MEGRPPRKHNILRDIRTSEHNAIIPHQSVRVLTVTSSYPKFDGDATAPFIESITRELAGRGHELTVVLPKRSDLSPVPIEGVRFRPYRYAPSGFLEVFGYAEALRADVALKGTVFAVTPAAVASAAWAIRRELARQPYDVLHAHWVIPNGAIARLAMPGIPLLVSLHGSDVYLSEKSSLAGSAARRVFVRAAAATACSDDLADRALPLGARTRPTVIPYGVDTELFRPDPSRRERGMLLATGRLVHKKGFEHLIDAAAILAKKGLSFRLAFAGDGDLEPALRRRADGLGLADQVRFLGRVSRDALPSLFASADAIVVPSVHDDSGNVDGLPNVLLEAMAAGAGIVATTVGGIPQAVRHGSEALLVPEKDAPALAAAIEKILGSCELRNELGASARKRALEAYSWTLAGERYEDVLRTVTTAGRS